MRLLTTVMIFLVSSSNSQAVDLLGIEKALEFINTQKSVISSAQPAATSTTIPTKTEPEQSTQPFDYSVNLKSDVFGTQLFTGNFSQQGSMQFNPDYMIEVGDQIQVQLWGGFSFNSILTVDPQGNIFLPQIGPLKVLGIHNQNLQSVLETTVRRIFRANVYSYANLAAAQPVRIFVGGFVNRPGIYNGTSMDSLLFYLDQAGGIDAERGSFLDVQVKRGEQVRTTINLYDFLLKGRIPLVQLADGDVIFIPARQNALKVTGLVENAKSFEFRSSGFSIKQIANLAKPQAKATHVRVIHNKGSIRNIDYYALADAGEIQVESGDEVQFTADKKPGTITVRVEGEHQSALEYVLPYGSHFGELLQQIKFSDRSDAENLQLFRKSVRDRQKEMLQASLKNLEASVLTASSETNEEALLRKEEADLVLKWVERAKTIEPNGQVVIAKTSNRDELLLEDGDIIKVPKHDGLVLVSGEVIFPNTVAYNKDFSLEDYIKKSGGYTQNASSTKIVIAHQDGSFENSSNATLRAGDEVLVLPEIQIKSRQLLKDIGQVIYQIAISARVVTSQIIK